MTVLWAHSSAGSASCPLHRPTPFLFFRTSGLCTVPCGTRANYGPIAQLGERSVRIREVEGSNPFGSTTKKRTSLL